jgi:proton-dependent oligopeptide transporter, POT family
MAVVEQTARRLAGHPRALSTLFFTELWERFSYYGMRALLTLFMVAPASEGGLGLATPDAARIYGNYTMAVYMLAIPGGFIADRWLGAKRAVITGCWIIAAGHFALAVPSTATFAGGLILVALGSGLMKPNISAMVGALYAPGDPRRDAGFSIFYLGVNLGAFIAPIVTGFLAQSSMFKAFLASNGFDPNCSWHWGFAAAGVGMVLGLAVLWREQDRLAEIGNPPRVDKLPWAKTAIVLAATAALMALVVLSDRSGFESLRLLFVALPLAAVAFFARAVRREGGAGATGPVQSLARGLAAVFVFFIAAMLFWALFEQAGFTIALFAEQSTQPSLWGFAIPSSWYQALNPLFVIALAPAFAALWVRLGDRQPSSAIKFAFGLALLTASYLLMVPAAVLTVAGKVSPLWLVGLFFLQTLGELCLSPVGLSTMTRLAPPHLVGLILGLWFLAASFGSKIAALVGGEFQTADPAKLAMFFVGLATMAALATVAMLAVSPWLKRLMGDVR